MKARKRRRPILEAADPRFRMMGAPLHMPLRPAARKRSGGQFVLGINAVIWLLTALAAAVALWCW